MPPSILDGLAPSPATGQLLSPGPPARQAPGGTLPPPAQPQYRDFGDANGTRQLIFDNALAAASALEPASNPRHTLSLQNVGYAGQDKFSIAEQKQALLSRGTLARRLQGEWVLADPEGNEVSRRRTTLAKIPYLTDRGTFIQGGNEYTMAHQMRLRPGVFTRVKENDELEAHVNVSKGFGHRIFLDPKSGVFRIQMGQAKIPLLPLLKAMGVPDSKLRDVWGNELTAVNTEKADPSAVRKLYGKLHRDGEDTDELGMTAKVVEAFNNMELDPEVTKATLGRAHTNVGSEALMDITGKLLRVARGEEKPDDRDAMSFQTLLGPEDQFAERLKKARHVVRQLLWKSSPQGNLDRIKPNAFGDAVNAALMGSGLGMPIEEINPADIFDQQVRVTRMGEGGIPSLDAVPDEARAVQPTQFGFIDFLRTPESGKVGVDARMSRAAKKGKDGRVYIPVRNQQGEEVYQSAQDLADKTLAFPNELRTNRPYVAALVKGKVRMVPRESVDFEVPRMEDTFSPLGNMIPLKSMVKGQRAVMAARMLTQALPLAQGEAPLVQSGVPGAENESFEEKYAKHMGAMRADQAGRVEAVNDDSIVVRYQDGSTEEKPLYHNFPFNRKTFLHQTPTVKPGDAFKPGQLLARSNFTNEQGTTALGKNLRVAYVPWGGLNFEDANVISQSAAKALSSEHMYQHGHEFEDNDRRGKKAFVSIFPGRYDRATLEKFNDQGFIQPGTEVKNGDPLVLVARQRERNRKSLLRGNASSYQDATIKWEHHDPGVVTDVVDTDKGVSVVVKATSAMEVGDKLSGRYGDKGIIAAIIPDEQMPKDSQGRPFQVLLNPLGVISRTNPAQIVEAALGKIAEARGEPFKVPDFEDQEDLIEFALAELKKAQMSDTEAIVDPRNDRKIPDVFTGNRWFMKLHHTSESKNQGRGLGAYTAEQSPARGGPEGAKRVGMLETNALLSHGATEVIRDSHLVRGQANPQYWAQYMSGHKPPTPEIRHVYSKFVNSLKASGINVVRDGTTMNIMAMTPKDIDEMTGSRELKNVETVDWKTMEPVPGGLFDKTLTGGHMTPDGGGNRWAHIKLHEPLPNPAMEEPIRRVLGLTKNQFNDVLKGTHKLNDQTGPKAIATALNGLNLDREIERARAEIDSGKRSARDTAVRRLGYLKSAKRLGIHPKEWVLDKVPVLPPAFRPVSTMGPKKLPLVADPNYLYKELWDTNTNLREASAMLDEDDIGEERLAVYDAFKGVTGLGSPTHPKNQERQVKGILKHVFGSSPKLGTVQRRLLGSTTDLVGRSVIAPDPDLDMDQVGIPESRAWDIYRPLVVRRLVRGGMPRVQAARAIEERSAKAREALVQEMDSGVVVINRAPTLHRYGMMAARPKLVKGEVMKIPPLIVGGFGADFDGDAMSFHVPATPEAQEEAAEKMLPSRNLFSAASFNTHYLPSQEYVGGLYEASARVDKKNQPAVFATAADAIRAYKEGRINVDRQVEILEK